MTQEERADFLIDYLINERKDEMRGIKIPHIMEEKRKLLRATQCREVAELANAARYELKRREAGLQERRAGAFDEVFARAERRELRNKNADNRVSFYADSSIAKTAIQSAVNSPQSAVYGAGQVEVGSVQGMSASRFFI